MLLNKKTFFYQQIQTPLGILLAISDEKYLYVLQFIEPLRLIQELDRWSMVLGGYIICDWTSCLRLIEKELNQYFAGTLKNFTTPISVDGTDFQQKVWSELVKTEYGAARSYQSVATNIKHDKAVRAVGTANGVNKLAIIIPCHRIVQKSGKMGGYNAGIERKKWLLEHEQKFAGMIA